MKKPVIALSARESYIAAYDINMLANIDSYYDYIHLAGGIPATVYAHDEDEADAIAKAFDGLVLTGGADVDPSLYQEENTASYPGSPLIDASDIFLYHAFRKAGKPVLAVCRGIQVVAAAEGVHLIQDIPSEGYQLNHNQRNANPPLSKHDFCHSCIFSKGTRLYEIFGDEYPINSFHHQACRDIPEGFKEAGRSPDGIIEAFENGNVIGVQWHPERLTHDAKHLAIAKMFIKDANG
jgi:putative glutamine amidotransferase